MTNYARVRYALEIKEVLQNNPDYFGNPFLSDLYNKSVKSFLLEMEEIFLLEKPFFEKYAFVGLFKMNLDNWEKQSVPLTQLGLYNAFKNNMTSSPAYYKGVLKEKIEEYTQKNQSSIIESFYDENWENITREEYYRNKNNHIISYKISDLNTDKRICLTCKNENLTSKSIRPIIDNFNMLKILQELLEEGVDPKSLSEDLKKTIRVMENGIDIFKEEEANGYSIEKQWCVRVYGANPKANSYARWFKSKHEANIFMKKIVRDRSMSQVQSKMICLM